VDLLDGVARVAPRRALRQRVDTLSVVGVVGVLAVGRLVAELHVHRLLAAIQQREVEGARLDAVFVLPLVDGHELLRFGGAGGFTLRRRALVGLAGLLALQHRAADSTDGGDTEQHRETSISQFGHGTYFSLSVWL
jgi:hypothetical protein